MAEDGVGFGGAGAGTVFVAGAVFVAGDLIAGAGGLTAGAGTGGAGGGFGTRFVVDRDAGAGLVFVA